jgi:hypothetical protein
VHGECCPGVEASSTLGELSQLVALFTGGSEVKEILDDGVYRAKYSRVNLRKVVLVLEKYRNDKLTIEAAFGKGGSSGNPQLD